MHNQRPVLLHRLLCITICVTLLSGAQPAAAAPLLAEKLYLPQIARTFSPHPQAALLRQVGQAGFERLGSACGWDAGVLGWGWAEQWQATGDEQYWNALQSWVDGCLAAGATITHVNDVPLAYAVAVLQRRSPQPTYAALAAEATNYLFETAPRTQDGALIHLAAMVWDDTLIDVIPFLIEMWQSSGEARYLEEAVKQVQLHAAHLQDPATGLYHHAWSEPANALSGPFFWGRGNGWVLLSQAKLLAALPADDTRRPALAAAFQRQAAALVERQAANGMWHTVVSRSDFYVETSATALIAAGLASGVAQGLLDATAARAAADGAVAVWSQVPATGIASGIAAGVSGLTGPMDQEAAYNAIPISEFELYGQGVVLLLGAATQPAQ